MWHHEDAGIAFNVFRSVVGANATAHLVPVTGHFDDANQIERTRKTQRAPPPHAQLSRRLRSASPKPCSNPTLLRLSFAPAELTPLDAYLSSRAIFAHNIKQRDAFESVMVHASPIV